MIPLYQVPCACRRKNVLRPILLHHLVRELFHSMACLAGRLQMFSGNDKVGLRPYAWRRQLHTVWISLHMPWQYLSARQMRTDAGKAKRSAASIKPSSGSTKRLVAPGTTAPKASNIACILSRTCERQRKTVLAEPAHQSRTCRTGNASRSLQINFQQEKHARKRRTNAVEAENTHKDKLSASIASLQFLQQRTLIW